MSSCTTTTQGKNYRLTARAVNGSFLSFRKKITLQGGFSYQMNTAMYALNGFSGTVNCKITDLSGARVSDILVNRTFNSSNPITFGTPPSFTLTETGEYYIEFQATHNSAFAFIPGNPHLAATFTSIIQMARTVTLTARDQTLAYRYGFNGKMNLNDLAGLGMMQDYGFRMSMAGRGRFMSVDPLREKYPELTPYQFASNCPISGIDLDGLENHTAIDGHLLGVGPLSGTTLVKLNNAHNVTLGLHFSLPQHTKDAPTTPLITVNNPAVMPIKPPLNAKIGPGKPPQMAMSNVEENERIADGMLTYTSGETAPRANLEIYGPRQPVNKVDVQDIGIATVSQASTIVSTMVRVLAHTAESIKNIADGFSDVTGKTKTSQNIKNGQRKERVDSCAVCHEKYGEDSTRRITTYKTKDGKVIGTDAHR